MAGTGGKIEDEDEDEGGGGGGVFSVLASAMSTSRSSPRVLDALFRSRALFGWSLSDGGSGSQRTCVGCMIFGTSIRLVWIS